MLGKTYGSADTVEIVRRFLTLVSDAKDTHRDLYNAVGRCDRETSDIVHDIELSSFTAKEGNIKARTLQKIRRERRQMKDEMDYVSLFRRLVEENPDIIHNLEVLYQGLLNTKMGHEKRTYTPKEKPVVIDING